MMQTSSTYAPRTGVENLFLAAFDGVVQKGTRELRLSVAELAELKERFPMAEFVPMEESGEKSWYKVEIRNSEFGVRNSELA